MTKSRKRPREVPKEAKPLPDGRWVTESFNEAGLPHNGWRYYDASGETIEIAYFDEGTYTKSYRYFPRGNATIDSAERKGELVRQSSDAEPSFDDLPPFPSPEVMTIQFTLTRVDPETRKVIAYSDVRYFDARGKRLSASGGVGEPPVSGAKLKKTKHDQMWCSAPSGNTGVWKFYEIDGSPVFELELEDGELASIAHCDEGGWLRQRFLPRPAFETDKLRIDYTPKGPVLTSRGKPRTLDMGEKLASLVKHLASFFKPVLQTRGARVRIGEQEVTRFTHIPTRKPFAVTCIAERSGGDEYVVVLEPGAFSGRVFLNNHEEGLFSVDTLDEWVEDELPELLKKNETVESVLADRDRLIALTPFASQRIAESVEAFVRGLRVELAEDWHARLKPFVKGLPRPKAATIDEPNLSKAPKKVAAKKVAAKKAVKKVAVKVAAKKARRR